MTKLQQKKQLQNMEKTLDFFIDRISKSSFGNDIDKIILFGSMLHKKVHDGSDIDIAIIAKNPEEIESNIDEISYDAVLEHGELIEPILYSTRQLIKPTSPFLMKILSDGKEVFTH